MKLRCLWFVALLVVLSILANFVRLPIWAQNSTSPTDPQIAMANLLPDWAYIEPGDTGGRGPATGGPDADKLRHVPGSDKEYASSSIGLFNAPDWFPDSHPPMPEVVVHGRKPNVWACAYCHLPNGMARPENESIAGLPEAYIEQQIADYKSGLRKSSDPKLLSVEHMTAIAKAVSDEDIKASAMYYASLSPFEAMHVIETDTVPKTQPVGFMLQKAESGTEPIGERIIELPEDRDRTVLQDPRSGFIVYVPTGSIKNGEAIVNTGGDGKTIPCAACHGANLRGLGNVPSIAGRSPSQMVRQIIDFQTGARNGQGSQLMKPVVKNLNIDDIVNVVSYLTSLKP